MARYVDGFLIPVPKRNFDAYRRMARKAGRSGASTARWKYGNASRRTSRWEG
jgi:uncharacterized protein YbaA (DUF1428 family)